MGRPSLAAERREQILDAYEVCLARYGVEGATLEKVGEAAGLARPLIRHNIGNRDALLDAFVARFLERSAESLEELTQALPSLGGASALVDVLFDPRYSDAKAVLVAEALYSASQDRPELAERMRSWTEGFVKTIRSALAAEYSAAEPDQLDAVATGIVGLYFNAESISVLGAMDGMRDASRRAATLLLQSLGPAS